MKNTDTKILSDEQLDHFNTDLMLDSYWKVFLGELEKRIDTSKPFLVLDIGGGNGNFADVMIEKYPNVTVTILDNSEYLLSLNTKNERKKLLLGSATRLDEVLSTQKFDLITFNWVLHHLVMSTRKSSLKTIQDALKSASKYVNSNGYISIIENLYNGIAIDQYPSKFIFNLTSIKLPLISKLVRKAGFNTAGTGVCFMSEKLIIRLIEQISLEPVSSLKLDVWRYNALIRLVLHTQPMSMKNIWLTAK